MHRREVYFSASWTETNCVNKTVQWEGAAVCVESFYNFVYKYTQGGLSLMVESVCVGVHV